MLDVVLHIWMLLRRMRMTSRVPWTTNTGGGDFKSYFIIYMYNIYIIITLKRIRQPSDVNPHIIYVCMRVSYAALPGGRISPSMDGRPNGTVEK